MPNLAALPPGTRFRLVGMEAVTGVLVQANECRAVVRLDRPVQEVEFQDASGDVRHFRCRGAHVTSWAPTTVVVPVFSQTLKEDDDMTTKTKPAKQTKTKAPQAEKTKAPKAPKAPKADGKLSCIDAAAKVLADAKEPMTTKAMIEAMGAKGLWSSPNGQTPAATLYSAILREIKTKGKEARFKKSDRGLFAING